MLVKDHACEGKLPFHVNADREVSTCAKFMVGRFIRRKKIEKLAVCILVRDCKFVIVSYLYTNGFYLLIAGTQKYSNTTCMCLIGQLPEV